MGDLVQREHPQNKGGSVESDRAYGRTTIPAVRKLVTETQYDRLSQQQLSLLR